MSAIGDGRGKDAGRIRRELADRIRRVFEARDDAGLLRADVLVEGINALDWLEAQPPGARGYWRDREMEFELAGVGRADMVSSDQGVDGADLVAAVHQRIDGAAGPVRYFGGLRFGQAGPLEPGWDVFLRSRFVLPRFELVRRSGVTTLSCNIRREEGVEAPLRELETLVIPAAGESLCRPAPAPALAREDQPNRERWMEAVDQALHRIRSGRYRKIVLSRRSSLRFAATLDSGWLLRALRDQATHSFVFCFQPDAAHAFLGASPERLYRRDGRRIRTEAIAGTRPRYADSIRDRDAGRELRTADKDGREHRIVVDGIREALAAVVDDLVWDPDPELLTLTHAQHLVTRFRGMLGDGVTDGDLLRVLHPTPAVGGDPRAPALEDIPVFEGFDRGYFAAPVGWVERDAAQFAVGIRSGLLDGDRLHLYAGAGLVDGSDGSEEWFEIENKIADFLAILPPMVSDAPAGFPSLLPEGEDRV